MRIFSIILPLLLSAVCAGSALADDSEWGVTLDKRLMLEDIKTAWTDNWVETNSSMLGTPFVHGFNTKSAFNSRSIHVDYSLLNGNSVFNTEVEYTFTQRLSGYAALPFTTNTDDEFGFGNADLGAKALLIDGAFYAFSTSLELGIPSHESIGTDDYSVAGSIQSWFDFGNWVTLQADTGIRYVDNGHNDYVFDWSVTLAKSFCTSALFDGSSRAASLIAEISGNTLFDNGATGGTWLVGGVYPLSSRLDLRAAFTRTFDEESGFVVGFIFDL